MVRASRVLSLIVVAVLGPLAWAYSIAISDPVVRHADFPLLPHDGAASKVRILLISDIHVAGPDMPPSRLMRIVSQANSLKPDVVLIAGDLVSDKRVAARRYSMRDAVEPLQALRARFGVFAVLGNHDHWRNAEAARQALGDADVKTLDNSAVLAGPLVVGGLDDAFTRHDDLRETLGAMEALSGVPVLLSHSPDPFPRLPKSIALMVAGHTHCGQISLPIIGALSYMSGFGDKYACGVIQEGGKTLVVSAGLGTSLLPLRIGAVPDMWLITLQRAPAPR
jgi:predicted MPP superfamily phosphohydrolase